MGQADFDVSFEDRFKALTGYAPLSWQWRLYRDWIATGDFPNIIDLPTGLGKTMVMAVWLLARAAGKKVPTRLIYVVDRRTVVDQATDLAVKLQDKFGKDDLGKNKLVISTLRGQLADNREWSRDPSRPAIIIGTVDLIGSALLFSGYRSSFKTKPLHAGLLGQDSLLVLDEAHLSKPFEKLLGSISKFQGEVQPAPMKVIRMSATSGGKDIQQFTLTPEDDSDEVILTRYTAKKSLKKTTGIDSKKLNEQLADTAIKLVQNPKGNRIVVFVRKPEDAKKIAEAIRNRESTKTKPGPYSNSVEVLTGTMRGLERDELLEKPVLKRFLDGGTQLDSPENQEPMFLISTSAGEVGFDLNADHLVCDAAPLDSMIQRLGRVNRRGLGTATVELILSSTPPEKSDFEKACVAASKLFSDGMDVSPQALAKLKKILSAEELKAACTPEPTMVELTDILLDAWSMTSITATMPGRPPVAPWLRGIADELPQTTIAWRAELDQPGFDQLELETVEEWFDSHRLLTHETLSVPTGDAAKWFLARWNQFSDFERKLVGPRSLIVDRAGVSRVTINDLRDQLDRKNYATITNAELIFPASFGGIETGNGLLDADAPKLSAETTELANSPDVADARGRYREIITKIEDAEPDLQPLIFGAIRGNRRKHAKFRIELESDDDRTIQLFSYVPEIEKPEYGSVKQTLTEHVTRVRERIDDILSRIELDDALKSAARLAADFHDHGKNRLQWQRLVGGQETPDGPPWNYETLGKSGGVIKHDSLGYRHEFGSLREFIDAHQGKLDSEIFDLAMHLIATHHGRGRPHFPKGAFDPADENRSEAIHTESIRRFARLQRKYGHWRLAWLENLLRCADALASADAEASDEQGGDS